MLQVLNNFAPDLHASASVEGKRTFFFLRFNDSKLPRSHGYTVTVSPVDKLHHPSKVLRTLRIVKRTFVLIFLTLKKTFHLLSSGLIKPCRHLFAPSGVKKKKRKIPLTPRGTLFTPNIHSPRRCIPRPGNADNGIVYNV